MSELKLDKFDQIGIVVRDIEKAAKLYGALFEFKGSINIVEQSANVIRHGQEVLINMKKIMGHFGSKQLEIVQVINATGPNLYSEFVEAGNTGLHHIGIYVKDAEKFIDQFKTKFNIEIAQVGKVGKLSFTYLDTKDILGYYIELIQF